MARKPKTQPTFEERLASAHTTAAAAVSVFEQIAQDLEQAAVEKKALVVDIDSEINRLEQLVESYHGLAAEAEAFAEEHLAKAGNIRALMGN